MKYKIYTDGSCKGNPGPGGWAVMIKNMDTGAEEILRGGENHTTNNKMELTAIIRALEEFVGNTAAPSEIHIYSDSKYCVDGVTKWMPNWIKNNWKAANRKPVKNQELWREYLELSDGLNIKLSWIKAHNGHPENELVDTIAFEEATYREK